MTLDVPRLFSIGSHDRARECMFRYYQSCVPYKNLIEIELQKNKGVTLDSLPWERVPILDKNDFYEKQNWESLIPAENKDEIFALTKSSGYSGVDNKKFYWPRLREQSEMLGRSKSNPQQIIQILSLDKKRTLFVMGFLLGDWWAGQEIAFQFRNLSIKGNLPLTVYSPGNSIQSILDAINSFQSSYDQILIGIAPSSIEHLKSLAADQNISLPWDKLSFMVSGEPFSELQRINLTPLCGSDRLFMFSFYATADVGIVGFETLPLIQIRQLLFKNSSCAKKLGLESGFIPQLFHSSLKNGYIEELDGQLLFTAWQGIPVVRYNLKDRGKLYSWKGLCQFLSTQPELSAMKNTLEAWALLDFPDVIALEGRSDDCVFLGGSNIFPHMLEACFQNCPKLSEICTSSFFCWVDTSKGSQKLVWQFELKANANEPNDQIKQLITNSLIKTLCQEQPGFASDYEKNYRNLTESIFSLKFVQYPKISQHRQYSNRTKKKIILPGGV